VPAKNVYFGDLLFGGLQVRESRIIAQYLLDELSQEEWEQHILTENSLQKRSQASAYRVARGLQKRLTLLPLEFLQKLVVGDSTVARQICFLSMLLQSPVLKDFLKSQIHNELKGYREHLATYCWDEFLQEIESAGKAIPWSVTSRKKIRRTVWQVLAEVGYLTDPRTAQLQAMRIDPEVRTLLENSDLSFLISCLEVQ
jgi:hypothetical protein